MDYINEFESFMYLQNKANQQISMESYIQECIILAENTNVVGRLRAFNEADSAWDKIKNGFKKFWEFIKRIFARWVEKVTRLFQNNKDWLDKHRAIILNNKFKFESVNMYNYSEGIKRMTNSTVPMLDFDQLSKDDPKFSTREGIFNWVLKENAKNTNFKYVDKDTNATTEMKNFFRGGEDKIDVLAKDLNMTDLFNYCYTYDKMQDKIKKDYDVINNAVQKVTTALSNKAASATVDSSAAAANNASGNNSGSGEAPKTEGAVFSRVYGAIEEADAANQASTNGKPDHTNDGPTYKASTSTGYAGDKNQSASSNTVNIKGSGETKDDGTEVTQADKNQTNVQSASNTTGDDIAKMSERCSWYQEAAGGTLSAKLTICEEAYLSYMKILKAHVDSYIGREQKNNKITQIATTYGKTLSREDAKKAAENVNTNDEQNKAINKAVAEFNTEFQNRAAKEITSDLTADDVTNKVESLYVTIVPKYIDNLSKESSFSGVDKNTIETVLSIHIHDTCIDPYINNFMANKAKTK